MARSLVASLAESKQTLFPHNYWEQGAHRPDAVVEEQRLLLREFESRRVRFHPDGSPVPIRTVHVAWGLIRLDGKFLLRHREDRSRVGLGNYVLPGGRFSPADCSGAPLEVLAASQSPSRVLSPELLERTLIRELEEELGLLYPDDYTIAAWRNIQPWRQVEGARNHQAFTEYLIAIFNVRLTSKGELRLYEHLNDANAFWFSTDDLVRQTTNDGKRIYLDALLADLGNEFGACLESVQESLPDKRLAGESESVDFPWRNIAPLLRGKTGKEKPVAIELAPDERSLLLGLAWHARGFSFDTVVGSALPRGWFGSNDDLVECASTVARKLGAAGCPLLEIQDNHIRLNLHPDCVFFDPACYQIDLVPESDQPDDTTWLLRLSVPSMSTALGKTSAFNTSWSLTRNTARIIQAIQAGKDPEVDYRIKGGDIQKTLRDQIDRQARSCGLRKLVRIDAGHYRLAAALGPRSASSPLDRSE